MQTYARDVLAMTGAISVVVGVACWSGPAAAIVAGLAAIGLSVLWARAAAGKK